MRDYTITSQKAPVTWILVADGAHAQVYRRSATEKSVPVTSTTTHPHFTEASTGLALVPDMGWKADASAIYDAGSKDPAKAQDNAGTTRREGKSHLTFGDEIKEHFTTKVANELSHAFAQKSFDRLVLVAPAKMLGELRTRLEKSMPVVASLSKDLTHLPATELMTHLKDIG